MASKKGATATEEAPVEHTAPVAAKAERKARVSSEDAVFLEEFSVERPPAGLRDYVLTPYDHAMDQMWDRYETEGSPAWSRAVSSEKPDGGFWSDRDDIYVTTLVPDVDNAKSLINRAARRIGCSSRIRSAAENGAYRIWFTAAPLLPRSATANEDGADTDTETTGD